MSDNRRELLSAVAAAAAASTADGEGDERLAEQYEGILAYVKRHSSRSDDLNLGEVFQTMPKKDHTRVWASVLKAVAPIVDEGRFLAQEEEEEEEEKEEGDGEEGDAAAEAPPAEGAEQQGATPERPSTPESSGVGTVPGRPRRGVAAVGNGGGGGGGSSSKDKNRKGGSQERVALSMEILHAAATLALEFLADKDRVAPRALMDTAVYLHEIILSLQGLQGIALQTAIAKVCEMWWTQERPGAEHLVSCLLPVMLVRSLDLDAKEADVKRMHGLRAALMLLDYEDESGDGLRGLLLRTYISPVYLKCSEGRRLLASFFGLHPSLVGEIHAVIKAQMPGAKKAVLSAYGEVCFRVWRGAEGPYLQKVEMLCLQDLMHACIHASTPKMHQNIRIVLDGLHSQKKVKGVDADLLRLYGPVMWRSLRVANPSVRAQACQVLVDAFPLQDPAAGAAAYDTTLQQQFDALTNLLEDSHPEVRAAAAKGACRVLSVFWEMVPIDTTRALLTRVVGRLASDGASPLVRLAAVEGLTLLLECPASHSVLKSMLPGVQNLIHDNNKKVRTAFVGLLLAVKGVKSIRYYQVANVDHILARLSEDHLKCPASALGLSKLILNSYFPTGSGVSGSEQVSRCLTLLSQDEGAAVAFFSRLHKIAGVPSAAKMIAMLVRCVLVAARTPPEGDDDGVEGAEAEDGHEEAGKANVRKGKRKGVDHEAAKAGAKAKKGGKGGGLFLRASDSKTMAGILNLIASTWESILPDLAKSVNEPSLELVQQTVTGEALSILHRRFCGQDKCRAAFMRVAGLAGGDLAPGMLEDIVIEMLALPADAPASAYGPTVDLLCSWGQHEHLLGAVVDSLKRAFLDPGSVTTGREEAGAVDEDPAASDQAEGSRGKRRRPVSRKRGSADAEEDAPGLPAPLALNMLGHLLAGGQEHPSTKAARDAIMANAGAVDSLEAALVLARSATTARLSSPLTPPVITTAAAKKREAEDKDRRRRCPDALLVRAVEALGRVYMHREAALVDDSGGNGSGSGAALAAAKAEAGGTEEEMSMLQPMPFSVKMRELVVWATNTVLPVLVGDGGGGGSGGVDMVEGGGGTPVRPAGGVSLVAESPSPMPPPRSRARASLDNGDGASAAAAAAAAAAAVGALAGGVFGVVVLLASEWVEVGSGLAEISMRADTWGNRLLALLMQEDDDKGGIDNMIHSILPQLCRLSLNLSVRESQGARPPESIWQVLLRCADLRISASEKPAASAEEEQEGTSATCVQKYLAAAVALQGKKGGMSSLTERLLGFMFTQAFTSDEEEEQQDSAKEDASKAPSIDRLTRLEVCAVQDADSDEPAGCMLLQLSRPAAAVLASVVRAAPASKAAGALVLSHLAAFGSGDVSGVGADACWPLFCAHVLGALIEHAPAKTRLQLAADAHAGLKAAAAASASPLSSSFMSARSGGGNGSVVLSPASLRGTSTASGGDVSTREEGEEEGVSMRKAAAFVVGAIYGRLEAARLAASGGGAGRGAGGVGVGGAPAAVAVSA